MVYSLQRLFSSFSALFASTFAIEGFMKKENVKMDAGRPLPLGVSEYRGGFNFSVISRNATAVFLELYEHSEDSKPFRSFPLDPDVHRTGDIWHVRITGINYGQLYAYRAEGPYEPENGHRFNGNRILLDPYAKALVGTGHWDFEKAQDYKPHGPESPWLPSEADNARWSPKCAVVDTYFDWQDDRPPRHSWADTLIYETHVRGLTIDPSSAAKHPGTFLGVMEKIPYFKQMGVTAVELMPVQEFNEKEIVRNNPLTGERLHNYWGYNTVAFMAPKEGYGTLETPASQVNEFKLMVRELHKAGIEVILDIVFNHTAEGNEWGPTLNLRGLENRIYYMLEPGTNHYRNYSGCGNTLNCNHPLVRTLIMDSLRQWVAEMHVDGFRFDLASVLGRDRNGEILPNPPLLERIAQDPLLRDTKLIAEAWDAGGAYQVGIFPGRRWSDWNGQFRDDVRKFWRGDAGMAGKLASRICGSADLYERSGKAPLNSINFITCHDGLTLHDLVSYSRKHNETNGEDNRDGTPDDFSANYGVEGETKSTTVRRIRSRQVKNLLATLFISRGVPMILGGDEFGRTQKGNNNAYCQDNEVSWYDWKLLKRNRDLFRFTREMIAFRKKHPVLRAEKFYREDEVIWFGPSGEPMKWESEKNVLGCKLLTGEENGSSDQYAMCLLFNADEEAASFELPEIPKPFQWFVVVDTAQPSPQDIVKEEEGTLWDSSKPFNLKDRSLAILLAQKPTLVSTKVEPHPQKSRAMKDSGRLFT